MNSQIIIITGAPGSGKTTVSLELCKLLKESVHIPLDKMRHMVKNGFASARHWDEVVEKQYLLARLNTSDIANRYVDNGYIVIIDDIVTKAAKVKWQELLKTDQIIYILLLPTMEVTKSRNIDREWPQDEEHVQGLYETLRKENTEDEGWLVIDNSNENASETAQKILKILNG